MTLGMRFEGLTGFLYIQHFTAFVVAAFRTSTMRQFALVTIRTFGK
jgi:hypothetical protein